MVNYCKSPKSLIGKTTIVTGANTGIGYETALEFAKRGARVILACRNQQKGNEAQYKLVNVTANDNVAVKLVDMESLDSVREFCADINANEDRLDILVNNAGAYLPDKMTKDGFQLCMQVNYFSPFLLTHLLLDLLKKSAPSRIINVASNAAMLVHNLDLNDLASFPGSNTIYGRSKLCQMMQTQEMARRLAGSGVTTYSLHPGIVHTEFQRFSNLLDFVGSKVFLTPEEGAQTSIYLSLQDGIEELSGRHFDNSKPIKPYCGGRDPEKAKQLYDMSLNLVGLGGEKSKLA